jgi:hypothetical protein
MHGLFMVSVHMLFFEVFIRTRLLANTNWSEKCKSFVWTLFVKKSILVLTKSTSLPCHDSAKTNVIMLLEWFKLEWHKIPLQDTLVFIRTSYSHYGDDSNDLGTLGIGHIICIIMWRNFDRTTTVDVCNWQIASSLHVWLLVASMDFDQSVHELYVIVCASTTSGQDVLQCAQYSFNVIVLLS